MNSYVVSETHRAIGFRERLRWEYKTFDEYREKQKKANSSEYYDLEKKLQHEFDELFGDDND